MLHSKNKVFASADGANAGRAHPRCNCAVVLLRAVDNATFQALFSTGTSSADRRTAAVAALLDKAAVPESIIGMLPLTGSSIGTLAVVGTAAVVTGGALRLAAWRAQGMESRSTASTAAR